MKCKVMFFIGTEAELIKMFPVILECDKNHVEYGIIASGQNNIADSRIIQVIGRDKIRIFLSDESDIKKSAAGLLRWFTKTVWGAAHIIECSMPNLDFPKSVMVVHGDTVSTLMGAYLGKKLKMKVCHVEAGLRSHHLFNPFPEEIDRLLTSRKTDVHFAPGNEPYNNLKRVKGKIVNTKYNTIIDSLRFAMQTEHNKRAEESPYFVFVLHRQESLMNKKLTCEIVHEIYKKAKSMRCVIILHEITRVYFEKYNLLDELEGCKNITMYPRMEYFDFMQLLYQSEFVLTDGGSNQEELHYMGKPCLILRTTTERKEGLGSNAKLYDGKIEEITKFIENYKNYEIESKMNEGISPSKVIMNHLSKMITREQADR